MYVCMHVCMYVCSVVLRVLEYAVLEYGALESIETLAPKAHLACWYHAYIRTILVLLISLVPH